MTSVSRSQNPADILFMPRKLNMKKIRLSYLTWPILSGLLTALAFPKFNLSFFSWISLLPLFFILRGAKRKHAFVLGWLSGLAFYGLLLYWIPAVPAHYGGLSIGLSLFIYLLLIAFLALFWGLFTLITHRLNESFPKWSFLLAPFAWVSLEYILTHILTGFPWGLLGYSQHQNLFYLQLASITGIYGLSFFLVLFQASFVHAILSRRRSPFFAVLSCVLLIHLGGYLSIELTPSSESDSFIGAAVQGNVSSDISWSNQSYEEILNLFDRHLELSREACQQGADLVIWPELSVPLCFSCPDGIYPVFIENLSRFSQSTGCTFLLGTYEISGPPESPLYTNSAVCLKPDLSRSRYDKMHLVPFGEYTPYTFIFGFISNFTHAIGELTPGDTLRLHEHRGIPFASPICYEIIFPNQVRRFVKLGAQFLVTITNDGWYGTGSAPHQHFAMAAVRAVENRRYLLRSATTGISGIVDPYGRILSRSNLHTQTVLSEKITPRQRLTIYSRCGDVLSWSSLTLTLLFLILAVIKRKYAR